MLAPLFLSLVATLGGSEQAPIHWREHELKFNSLPEDLPANARAAIEAWYTWASSVAYRLDLDKAGRVLVLSRASNDRAPKQLELASSVIARFDQELPAPPTRLAAMPVDLAAKPPSDGKGEKKPDHKPLPEDPEDPEGAHPWKLAPTKPEPTSAPPKVTKWGSQGQPLDSQTVVLLVVTDQGDFEDLLKHLASEFPYLDTWTREAKALQGFVLGDPLSAAYLERPAGVEEWDPDHELVNRLARLALLARYGDLPNWFVQGYAWHMEFALQGSVYCFPWRDEFVGVGEHSGWHQIVRDRFLKTRIKPADFMNWRRGAYRDPEAKASWGMSEYLVAKEGTKLPGLLDLLRVFREEHGRVQDDPNSWRRDVDYEIPLVDQNKLLVQVLGPDYPEHASLFFRQELAR